MTTAKRLASRILLAAGALALAGCGGSDSDITGGGGECPPVVEKCLPRADAWLAAHDGPGGAGGSATTPDRCPTSDDIPSVGTFLRRVGFSSNSLVSARTDGDQCCYTAPLSDCIGGRPFVVEGALRMARLRGEAAWG